MYGVRGEDGGGMSGAKTRGRGAGFDAETRRRGDAESGDPQISQISQISPIRGGRRITERDVKRAKCPYKSAECRRAWVEGARAYNRGDQENTNPYPSEFRNRWSASNLNRIWREGWFAARSRRLAARGFPGR